MGTFCNSISDQTSEDIRADSSTISATIPPMMMARSSVPVRSASSSGRFPPPTRPRLMTLTMPSMTLRSNQSQHEGESVHDLLADLVVALGEAVPLEQHVVERSYAPGCGTIASGLIDLLLVEGEVRQADSAYGHEYREVGQPVAKYRCPGRRPRRSRSRSMPLRSLSHEQATSPEPIARIARMTSGPSMTQGASWCSWTSAW